MEAVAALGPDQARAMQGLAAAWDAGRVSVGALLPGPGGPGAPGLAEDLGLPPPVVAFLAAATLRPLLEDHLAEARDHVAGARWGRGACPLCGAPPAFGDVREDGHRRLACHVCGGTWPFSRAACPFCGSERSADLVRLGLEGPEEGYAVHACRGCGGYLKEIDRRARWNGGPPLVEDWGSPHLDVAAARAGYRRPLPTLLGLSTPPGR
jgi:formate dehydrogenase maturation protein FdhE